MNAEYVEAIMMRLCREAHSRGWEFCSTKVLSKCRTKGDALQAIASLLGTTWARAGDIVGLDNPTAFVLDFNARLNGEATNEQHTSGMIGARVASRLKSEGLA